MTTSLDTFLKKAALKAPDLTHRQTINFNIGRYNAAVPKGKEQFLDLPQANQQAKNLKWQALENLDTYLLEFEKKITSRGATVLWASNAAEARQYILNICKEKNCNSVVKSKSMVTEEIGLNHFLKTHDIESIETDLGEYIQQLSGEPPYHIVTPAMHKSKEEVAALFASKLGTAPNLPPEKITLIARQLLRKKYATAAVGITGANFILPDIGGLAITENEGNARLCTAWPNTHIAVVGIEKMIPSVDHLSLFWPLLSTYGTGQTVTSYNTILTGPKQTNEGDGPSAMYVILLDNGRSDILKDPIMRQSLYCIRCGACLNACPVYKNIGGHTYQVTYTGPIGSVITPHLQGMKNQNHLSFASSLCGNCTAVCPVKINLHELLLYNRSLAVKQHASSASEKIIWKIWKWTMLRRWTMNLSNGFFKSIIINRFFTAWTQNHTPLKFANNSFNQIWKKQTS